MIDAGRLRTMWTVTSLEYSGKLYSSEYCLLHRRVILPVCHRSGGLVEYQIHLHGMDFLTLSQDTNMQTAQAPRRVEEAWSDTMIY